MHDEARDYYRELGRDYPVRIRQLVPAYDAMVEALVDLLRLAAAGVPGGERTGGDAPPRVLDLGIGEGTLARRVLEALPGIRLTGVDASATMLERARERLDDHGERIALIRADLAELEPPSPLGAAYSSLTLHNLPRPGKLALLRRLRGALESGAGLVWADLIRHPDPALQEHFTRRRKERARRSGCPEDFIAWNFEKESGDDHPLTPEGTLEVGREAGFRVVSAAWLRGVFGVFLLRA